MGTAPVDRDDRTVSREVVADALDRLERLAGDGDTDTDAVLAGLRAAHPGHRFHLVADRDAYDGSEHHALIVRSPAGATLSLAVAPARGLPWPLRGVSRAREYDLLDVDGTTVSVAEALATIDFTAPDRPLLRQLVDGCLVDNALDEDPVTVPDGALQQAADTFRRIHGLRRAADTRDWLAARGLTDATFAELMQRNARATQLRRRVAGDHVAAWFADHAADLEVLVVVWVGREPGAPAAQSAAGLATDALAELVRARREGRRAGLEEYHRGDLTGARAALATAAIGEAVELDDPDAGPVAAVVVDRRAAVLDPATRAEITHRLFDRWLAERRRNARITWFWGDERVTAGLAGGEPS